ncbi:hypothetical protein [Streptomyces sp. JJ36]|uniref:hypothetical protein n=1 Tax=Streptomyces sp. JJ36 TaxID=2736645 RepID=UPI001F445A0D|nr:hypothetical protein [Streptomyces sp. JJ36]MCF6524782.1 hypothetical protein [Streptomyces sp. JJ36]
MTRGTDRSGPLPGRRDPRRVLLVGAAPSLARKAARAGFSVWTLHDSGGRTPRPAAGTPGPAESSASADFADRAALRERIAATAVRNDIGWLLAFGAAGALPAVLETADRFGLSPSPAEAALLLADPAATRAVLNRSRHTHVPSAVVDSFARLPEAVARVGPPALVRRLRPAARCPGTPVSAAGADGGRPADAPAVPPGEDGPYLVERSLEGPVVAAETLTVHGMHRVLGIAALRWGGPAGRDVLFPAPLAARVQGEVRAAVTELLDLAGLEFGLTRVPVVLTAGGPRIAGCRRLDEEPVGRLIELATGTDPEAELFRALSGQRVATPRPHRYACAAPFRLPAGRLRSAPDLTEVSALPGVHRVHFPYAVGDELPGPDGESCGHVLVTAGSVEEAARRADAARRLTHVDVEPGALLAPATAGDPPCLRLPAPSPGGGNGR